MSREDQIAEAVLGRDAEEFCRSDVGRYILGRAKQEKTAAQEQLATVSAWRRRRIQELQNRIWRAESVQAWLVELIQGGRTAEQLIQSEIENGNADPAAV